MGLIPVHLRCSRCSVVAVGLYQLMEAGEGAGSWGWSITLWEFAQQSKPLKNRKCKDDLSYTPLGFSLTVFISILLCVDYGDLSRRKEQQLKNLCWKHVQHSYSQTAKTRKGDGRSEFFKNICLFLSASNFISFYSNKRVDLKHKVLTYVEYRAVSGFFQNIDLLPPLHPASGSSPPQQRRGGTHSPGGEGVGGQYFLRRQTFDWPLTV